MRPSIDHVQIAIPAGGEDVARGFYSAILGCEEVEKPANLRTRGGVWLMTENLPLHLGVDADFRPAGKAHVALRVTDLAGLRTRLIAARYTVVDDEPLPGVERFFVKDPFGNRVELLQPI